MSSICIRQKLYKSFIKEEMFMAICGKAMAICGKAMAIVGPS